ncbi:hypothetical protein fugu_008725 [Takifugu bimaculatus]|uniref:Alkaline ceramidase n=1 Tax=Takifugu bimaculatus TaxID=433685 RepID=A0A4Z2AXA2_9TELE|nr:hypothetical protein fugu_008725 [Takifugu bimaculatus]
MTEICGSCVRVRCAQDPAVGVLLQGPSAPQSPPLPSWLPRHTDKGSGGDPPPPWTGAKRTTWSPITSLSSTYRDGLEVRYICSFLGLAAVGVGSWCFHMTLLYEMQLLDELPMIYSTCVFVYCLYECFKEENSINLFSITLLLIFSLSVTVVYLNWKEPVFHQVMYGALVASLVIRSIFIATWVNPWLKPLCYTSLGVFLLGFLLWNIDNIFCETLRTSRHHLPPGVGVVTQFHAWWHILTGLGSYLHILLSLQIRSIYLKHRPKVKFICGVWPILHIEPQKKS